MAETLRVLVCDDEPGMRKGTERALRRHSVALADLQTTVEFAITTAASGEEALARVDAELPDILLLDYKLPGISGLQVQEELSERGLQVLTVMVSAYSSLQTVITATKRGAFDFLVKPFTPDELRATVRRAAHHLLSHRQALRLAQERRQIRFEFIRVLGHELKAPLAAVEGYMRLLEKRALGDDLDKYEPLVTRSLVRLDGMRKLILDLLDLTRIESGSKQRTLEEVDLRQAVAAAVETALPEAAKRRVTVGTQLPAPASLTADRGEIDIILNNLVSNAVKYNRDGGSVTVGLSDSEQHVRIAVADTGIGMSADESRKLFGEFVRIRNEKTAAILGSGLGLSIVKKLVTLYDGSIEVSSEPDVGTTFTVTLSKTAAPGPALVPQQP
jgi:two-component system, sensor histidine kinase and response regulator